MMRHIPVVTLIILVLLLPACTKTYTLSTSVSPSGSGSVSPNQGSYEAGSTVTVTAQRAYGYVFDHWSGDASGTSPTATITMDSDKSIIAYFIRECHEEVIGTIYDRMLPTEYLYYHYLYWNEYIQRGKNASLSWEADGTLNAYIFTEAQFNNFSVSAGRSGFTSNAFTSGYVARRDGYNGSISVEIKNYDRYYFVLGNPDYSATRKVYFSEAKITWCE